MRLIICYLLIFPIISSYGYTRLKNIKCQALNRTKLDVSACYLKDLGHGIVGANVHLIVRKPPAMDWVINFSVWRDQGGYKPFFYNVSLDFCNFLKNPSRLQLFYLFHQAILPYSNLNHSCPYTHDIIVKDFVLEDKMFSGIPIPKGSYMYYLRIAGNSVWATDFRIYMDIDLGKSLRKRKEGERRG